MACLAALGTVGAFALCGCSYRLSSLTSKDDADLTTGSLLPTSDRVAGAPGLPVAEGDLACARAAASDALSRGAKDSSVPWQNPRTGAGGNITPLTSSYREGGRPCRDFLASYVRGGSQEWLQGAACRTMGGAWEVRHLKPLKPS